MFAGGAVRLPAGGAGVAANTAGTDANTTGRTTTSYDTWGRPVTVTTPDGATTTAYDTAGRTATSTDPKGTTTYGYDGAGERRGKVTALTITRGGTAGTLVYGASYDENGQLTEQTLPGAMAQDTTYDLVGNPTSLTYTGQVTPVTESTDGNGDTVYTPGAPLQDQPWLSWTDTSDIAGRVRTEATGDGAATDGVPGVTDITDITAPTVGAAPTSDRAYTYDTAGRLTGVTDHTATGYTADLDTSPCTTRGYTFDNNGRRTKLVTTTHPDGVCDSTTGTTATTADWTGRYDTADRPTTTSGGTGSYVYDLFGRQTTLPAADTPAYTGTTIPAGNHDLTAAYYDDDLPRSVTQDGTTTTYTLDVDGHRTVETNTNASGTVTGTQTNHYTDGSDNPTWTDTTTGGVTTTSRYTESISGDLGATLAPDGTATLPLSTLHGDTVTTVNLPATQASSTPATSCTGWADYTEYGAAKDPTAAATVGGDRGYGWLGAKQRSTTATFSAGLTLMGDRLYNSARGLFTATDPEPGGSDNAYAYPTDPINSFDLNGHSWWRRIGSWAYRHRGALATVGATAGCAIPAVGWAACAGLQAAAWGVRSQQTAREHGGWRRNWRSMTTDAAFSGLSFGGGSALRYLRYGRMGGRFASGLARGFRNYHPEWRATSSLFRWHVFGSTHAITTYSIYSHMSQIRNMRRRFDW